MDRPPLSTVQELCSLSPPALEALHCPFQLNTHGVSSLCQSYSLTDGGDFAPRHNLHYYLMSAQTSAKQEVHMHNREVSTAATSSFAN